MTVVVHGGKRVKIMFTVMSYTNIVGRIFNMQIEAGIKSVNQSSCKSFNFSLLDAHFVVC